MSTVIDTWARRAGLALGLLLALAAVLSWRVPAEGAAVGAEVRFVAVPPGELTVAPAGAFLTGLRLRPGGPSARGELRLRNIAGVPLSVRLRGLPSGRDLDRPLRVRVAAGDRVVFAGALERLRSWTSPLVVAKGELRVLAVRAWLPVARAAAGAAVDVTVELRAEPRRG